MYLISQTRSTAQAVHEKAEKQEIVLKYLVADDRQALLRPRNGDVQAVLHRKEAHLALRVAATPTPPPSLSFPRALLSKLLPRFLLHCIAWRPPTTRTLHLLYSINSTFYYYPPLRCSSSRTCITGAELPPPPFQAHTLTLVRIK